MDHNSSFNSFGIEPEKELLRSFCWTNLDSIGINN